MKTLIIPFLTLTQILTNIQIMTPPSLKTKFTSKKNIGSLEFSVSTFGDILYSEKSVVQILLPSKLDNKEGCDNLIFPKSQISNKLVFLVERGKCTYSKKAFISQQSGAYAVLVYHNDETVDVKNIIPCSDSIYNNVKIPIVLISKSDGLKIRKSLEKKNDVLMLLDIDLPGKESEKIKSTFWLNPSSLKSYDFLVNFKRTLNKFGDSVIFEPLYKFKDMRKQYQGDFLKQHCFSNGKYCSIDSLHVESLSVLREGIRQICIWNISKDTSQDDVRNFWWNYIKVYKICLERHLNSQSNKELNCYEEIKETLKISENLDQRLNVCMDDSFTDNSDKFVSENSLLDKNANDFVYQNIYLVPAFFINGNLVKENLTSNLVTSAMCDKLIKKPSVCIDYTSIINFENTKKIKGNSVAVFLMLLFVGIVILFFILFLVRKGIKDKINKEISLEIEQHVSEYMRIKDSK